MKTHFVALAAVIAGITAGSAHAEQGINGTIKSIDSPNHRVTLDNGQVIQLHPSADMGTLREGGLIEDSCGSGLSDCSTVGPGSLGDTPGLSDPAEQPGTGQNTAPGSLSDPPALTDPSAAPKTQTLPGDSESDGLGGG